MSSRSTSPVLNPGNTAHVERQDSIPGVVLVAATTNFATVNNLTTFVAFTGSANNSTTQHPLGGDALDVSVTIPAAASAIISRKSVSFRVVAHGDADPQFNSSSTLSSGPGGDRLRRRSSLSGKPSLPRISRAQSIAPETINIQYLSNFTPQIVNKLSKNLLDNEITVDNTSSPSKIYYKVPQGDVVELTLGNLTGIVRFNNASVDATSGHDLAALCSADLGPVDAHVVQDLDELSQPSVSITSVDDLTAFLSTIQLPAGCPQFDKYAIQYVQETHNPVVSGNKVYFQEVSSGAKVVHINIPRDYSQPYFPFMVAGDTSHTFHEYQGELQAILFISGVRDLNQTYTLFLEHFHRIGDIPHTSLKRFAIDDIKDKITNIRGAALTLNTLLSYPASIEAAKPFADLLFGIILELLQHISFLPVDEQDRMSSMLQDEVLRVWYAISATHDATLNAAIRSLQHAAMVRQKFAVPPHVLRDGLHSLLLQIFNVDTCRLDSNNHALLNRVETSRQAMALEWVMLAMKHSMGVTEFVIKMFNDMLTGSADLTVKKSVSWPIIQRDTSISTGWLKHYLDAGRGCDNMLRSYVDEHDTKIRDLFEYVRNVMFNKLLECTDLQTRAELLEQFGVIFYEDPEQNKKFLKCIPLQAEP